MQFRYGLVLAWLMATLASILVAFAAVGSVRTAITDPPSALFLPEAPSREVDLPSFPETQASTVPDPEVADGAPSQQEPNDGPAAPEGVPAAPEGAAPETTQASPDTVATTQPAPTESETTSTQTTVATTQPASDNVETYETEGGWVTVRSSSEGAFLESASPKPGWTVETEGRGPEHFTVVFKGDDEEVHFNVSFDNGEVEIDVED